MDPTQFWLQQQSRRAQARFSQAEQRVRLAQNMRQVLDAANVVLPAELRALKSSVPGYRQLQSAVTQRLTVLLEAQLKELALLHGEEHLARRGRLISTEWCHLRGAHAPLYRRAEAESLPRKNSV